MRELTTKLRRPRTAVPAKERHPVLDTGRESIPFFGIGRYWQLDALDSRFRGNDGLFGNLLTHQ